MDRTQGFRGLNSSVRGSIIAGRDFHDSRLSAIHFIIATAMYRAWLTKRFADPLTAPIQCRIDREG